jgi:transposase
VTNLTDPVPSITVGVDTHGETHVAAVLDHLGGVIAVASFPTTTAGYRDLHSWAAGHGRIDRYGVEGTGCWGVGLSRHLRSEGVEVLEVCRPDRQMRRRRGKDDTIDAIAAARTVLAGEAIGPAKDADGAMEAMRVLRVVRRSATKERIASINQLRALVSTAPDQLRDQLRGLNGRQLVATAARLRPSAALDATSATKIAMRALAQRIQALGTEIVDYDRLLEQLIIEAAPAMLEHHGVGIDTASALLVAAGDNPDRLRNEAAWARLCGVAPVPASSGARHRHRLNRGGDRHANSALWRIVLVRMGSHPPTRAYVTRRSAEGLSKREIMRCLKRYVAREIYASLPRPPLDTH